MRLVDSLVAEGVIARFERPRRRWSYLFVWGISIAALAFAVLT